MADPEVQRTVTDLLGYEQQLGLTSLHVQPAAVYFRARAARDDLSPALVAGWLRGIVKVAERAEGIPPPAAPVDESKMEFLNRADRDTFSKWGCLIGGALLALVIGGTVLIVWLVEGS